MVWQGNHARYVEASEIQGHILTGYSVCSDFDTSLRSSSILGIWWHASQSLQCLCSPPKIFLQRHGCHFNAHPPGTHLYTCIYVYVYLYLSVHTHTHTYINNEVVFLSCVCSLLHLGLHAHRCTLCGRKR